MMPPALSLFLGSFAMVFLLVMQQHAVHHKRYWHAFINAFAIGGFNLLAIRLGASAGMIEAAAFLCGGALGTVASMWACEIHASSAKAGEGKASTSR